MNFVRFDNQGGQNGAHLERIAGFFSGADDSGEAVCLKNLMQKMAAGLPAGFLTVLDALGPELTADRKSVV